MVRAFLAIDLPLDIKKALCNFKNIPEPKEVKLKWVEEENLHLTLKFFGNISENLVEKIFNLCEKVCQEISNFRVDLGEVGVFPEVGKPRVLWIGVEHSKDRIEDLYLKIEKALKPLKLDNKKEKFHPHITLMRIKDINNTIEFKQFFERIIKEAEKLKGLSFMVKEIVLFKSDLFPTGPKYTPLKRIPLKDV
ncbi:MAG: RNA 2',3'-cyclic phosphodiesterase [Caldimicrobium sp.]